jgi:hypothetical protein
MLSLPQNVHTDPGAHPASCTTAAFIGIRRPRSDADPSPPSSVSRARWATPILPLRVFMAWTERAVKSQEQPFGAKPPVHSEKSHSIIQWRCIWSLFYLTTIGTPFLVCSSVALTDSTPPTSHTRAATGSEREKFLSDKLTTSVFWLYGLRGEGIQVLS